MIRVFTAALLVLTCAPLHAGAQPSATRVPRIFLEDYPENTSRPPTEPQATTIAKALGPNRAIAIGARATVSLPEGLNPTLGRYLDALAIQRVPAWIAVSPPAVLDQMPAWQASVRDLFARHAEKILVFEVVFADQPDALLRFALQVAATEARARVTATIVAAGGVDRAATDRVARSLTANEAPYVDVLSLTSDDYDASAIAAFDRAVPGARHLRKGREAGEGRDARLRVARDVLATVGTSTIATAWRGNITSLTEAVRALTPVSDLLGDEIETLDPVAVNLTLFQGTRDVRASVAHRVLFDQKTFSTYLIYDGAASTQSVQVALRLPIDGVPDVIDVIEGRKSPATGYVRDTEGARSQATIALTGRPMVVNFSEGASELFMDRTGAIAERQLSVEEVVARHRQYQARLDAVVRNYRAAARMEQHFRPSLTDPGYDVVTENRYFVSDEGVEWEELSFSVNGSKWGADRPAFPLLQAEKVLSLPLELRLNQDYRYVLAGTERVGAFDCYRVRFDPTREDEALYRGTVWIDRRTFARVKVQAVQTRTSAPMVSNEEIHTYEPVAEVDGFPTLLLTRLTARQIVLIAGRNLLLEKAATFSDFRLNADDFGQVREAARQGDRIMYRDTDRGVRYLIKEGEQRVVSERATTRARAMAMGVLVDPSFGYPLPIFGLNILDFEFRGRADTQFAMLFAGVLAAGNLQRPRLGGTPLDASLDFFAIAPPASDRLYVGGGERDTERLLTWPLSVGLNLGWQYTPFQKMALQYQFRFDGFVRDRLTSETFVVPSSTTTNGVGGAWEYKRGGYSVAVNGTWFARSSWRPWGPVDALEANPPRTYTKFAAHVSRDVFFNVFQKLHFNASYFGGKRLDRFSRYQFGLFDDTRIHGVPASGVRFDALGMVRGSYSLNILEQYRVDLFVEQAWGRDRAIDRSWRPLTGLGAAVNLRAPWNTILRADVGKGLLPDVYRDVGSVVFQVMLLKPLK